MVVDCNTLGVPNTRGGGLILGEESITDVLAITLATTVTLAVPFAMFVSTIPSTNLNLAFFIPGHYYFDYDDCAYCYYLVLLLHNITVSTTWYCCY